MQTYLETKTITRQAAQSMIEAAIKQAEELGISVNIAVVDPGGHLVSFARMDQAPILSTEIAINKAYTAIAFGVATHEWHPMIKDDPALREGIVHTPRLVVFGGGYPITIDNQVIGGIGVSGGSAEQDMQCCQAGLRMLEEGIQKN